MNTASPSASAPAAEGYQLDDLRIDVLTRRVLRDGTDLGVTSLSFDLLLALVRSAPALVTFEELMAQVWPGVVVGPETLTQRVKLLRQALGESAETPRYIVSVRGHGYRTLVAAAPLPASLTKATHGLRAPRRWRLALQILPVLLAGGAVAWWSYSPGNSPPSARRDEAHRYFLQAEEIVNGTPESFQAAVSLYDKAIELDPTFARAFSGRAMNRGALVWIGSSLGEGLDAAQKDAEQALALDPREGRAHAVLGSLHALRGRWTAAEASFRAAIDVNPADADARGRYAVSVLLPTGQLRRAAAEAAEAQRLEPGDSFAATMLAFVEHARGADDDAARFADLALSRAGDPRQIAPVYASHAARRAQYVEAAEHALRILPPEVRDAGGDAVLRQGYAALGDPAQRPAALAALRELTSGAVWERVDPRSREPVLYLYAELGGLDELYDEMERLLRRDGGAYPQIIAISSLWAPQMQRFRQDRRFQALVAQLGLLDYWQQAGPPDGCTLARSQLNCG